DAGNTGAVGNTGLAAIPNLAGWWRGDANGQDSVSGTLETLNKVTFAPGKFGQAFQFTGPTSAVSIPSSLGLVSPTFTIGGWFYLTQAPGAGSVSYLASKYNGTYYGWTLQVNSALVPSVFFSEAIG